MRREDPRRYAKMAGVLFMLTSNLLPFRPPDWIIDSRFYVSGLILCWRQTFSAMKRLPPWLWLGGTEPWEKKKERGYKRRSERKEELVLAPTNRNGTSIDLEVLASRIFEFRLIKSAKLALDRRCYNYEATIAQGILYSCRKITMYTKYCDLCMQYFESLPWSSHRRRFQRPDRCKMELDNSVPMTVGNEALMSNFTQNI